jgi:hypothetical protein
VLDVKLLSEVVQVAFSQRRKLMRHTLGRWLEAREFGGEFNVQRRAEEVPVAEYIALVQALAAAGQVVPVGVASSLWWTPAVSLGHEKSPLESGLFYASLAASRQALCWQTALRGCQPIASVEGTAHAKRQWRNVDEFVGRHHFAAFFYCLQGLIRPIPLADVWGAGYRKE